MKKRVWLCLALLAASRLLAAQAPAERPAAEELANGWLGAFNSGDQETLRAFFAKNWPSRKDPIENAMEFRAITGGFELEKTEESTATRFTALVKEKDSDQFARIVLEAEPGNPPVIRRLDVRAVPRPPGFAIVRLNEAEAIAGLGEYLKERAAADLFSGAMLVASHGKVIFSQAYGLAEREKKIPNRVSTQFRLGSMNKMFTAVSILQLAQEGKIKLTEPFGVYLTDYANKDASSRVTIEQLLTHTGGTGDIFGPEFDAHRLELRTLKDYVKLYEKRGLNFEPGTRWEYSNYGYLLLGVVIERVSGQSYYDYVRDHVFKPAGMNSTDSLPEGERVAERSIGYMREGAGPWNANKDTLPWRGTSAGGGYSTVEDLFRFAIALESHKLLDAAHTALLETGKVERPGGGKYGYGFAESNEGGLACFGHGGGAPGMNGELKICPQSGYVIAALANLDPPAAQRAASFVTARLPLKEHDAKRH